MLKPEFMEEALKLYRARVMEELRASQL